MRIFEIATTKFDPLLIEFWQQSTPMQLKYYFVQDNCFGASQDFVHFLDNKGLGEFAEIVPTGRMIDGKKSRGWFKTDIPDTTIGAFTKEERVQAREQGFDIRNKEERIAFIHKNNLTEEFCWIPHSWVKFKGKILDPSGFFTDGKSGQFDRFVTDKVNLTGRYHYF